MHAKKTGRSRAGIIIIVIAVIILLAAVAACVGLYRLGGIESFYPNTTINGISVSELMPGEATALLAEEGIGSVPECTITVQMPMNHELYFEAEDYCSVPTASELVEKAYSESRAGYEGNGIHDRFSRALLWLKARFSGIDYVYDIEISVDSAEVQNAVTAEAEAINKELSGNNLTMTDTEIIVIKGAAYITMDCEAAADEVVSDLLAGWDETVVCPGKLSNDDSVNISALYDSVYVEMVNAEYDKDTDSVTQSVKGVSFSVLDARNAWEDAEYGEEVKIELIYEEPEITTEALSELLFRDCLSSKTTSLLGSSDNRVNNVEKAANSINDIVLMPGEEFSYNDALGERTAENGYKLAGAYAGGETVQQYGGGICQVSSTLYYCSLYANLEITDRTCHMFPVSYLPPGLDATVSWGGPEYKFVNNREYPIRIKASVNVEERTLTVEIWGTDTDGTYVEVTYATWYTFDEEYTDVKIGYKAQTYREIYSADGTQLSREKEDISKYDFHAEDIQWPEGAHKGEDEEDDAGQETSEQPTEQQTPSDSGTDSSTESSNEPSTESTPAA